MFCYNEQFFLQTFFAIFKTRYGAIKKHCKLSKDLLLQQDKASCHKSREFLEAIEDLFVENKIWWSTNSPDISPIETVWAILMQELTKRSNKNLDELRDNILDIWAKFPNE